MLPAVLKVLLVGAGGREHALAWTLSQSDRLSELVAGPGNPGIAELARIVYFDQTSPDEIVETAVNEAVDLVVVGPVEPLVDGAADLLAGKDIPVFGPSQAAARLEASKSYAKGLMERARVPTGDFTVHIDRESAHAALDDRSGPYVVKADGLAAGRGVRVTRDPHAAHEWVELCFGGGFGEAGERVVIEDYLEGPEISLFGLAAGTEIIPLRAARDYKRLEDGGRGPNTEGMGAYTPVVGYDELWIAETMKTHVAPVLQLLAESGAPYTGFIYAGVVLTPGKPRVLEYNCRLGDPEAQVILPTLASDLIDLIEACLSGQTGRTRPAWTTDAAVDVVLASKGYPDSFVTGDHIDGWQQSRPNTLLFHSGTRAVPDGLVTAGGRVLDVVGLGPDVAAARDRAYGRVADIMFSGMQFRTDIGGRG